MEMQIKSAPALNQNENNKESRRKENRDYVRDYASRKKEEGYSRLAVFVPDEIREDVKMLVKQATIRFEKESRHKHSEQREMEHREMEQREMEHRECA